MAVQKSLVGVLNACDNFRPHLSPEPLVPFLLAPDIRPALGLLCPAVIVALRADNAWRSAHGRPPLWDIPASPSADPHSATYDARASSPPPYVAFVQALVDGPPTARTRALAETLERWRADANGADGGDGDGAGSFADVIGGKRWRAEFYDVYRSASASGPEGYVFSMERAACKLFGVITYGVHMTVYEQRSGAGGADADAMRIWVPRRAATKPTYPGMLDNSVAGGIAGGTSAFDTLVKEAEEEASLDPELVRKRARTVGSVSYYNQTKAGWLQPEVQYVYDLRLEPGEARLAPMDGEVESFELMSVDEVVSHMHAGHFKPNCALVLIEFLVRHGYLTPENEPRYLEINQRLRGQFDLERW
ncbi:NUDIX hydrolase domain-like protein [Russula brevipes]|nr:NUDIX hydrolase domain-like protein [Russula brevipes]